MCGVLKFVVASAEESKLGALFLNYKEGRIMRLNLQEMGQPQPATPIHCDNMTATGIVKDTIKKQRSRSMEMRFFESQIKSKAALWTYNGIQAKKILLIIQANTMIASTIK